MDEILEVKNTITMYVLLGGDNRITMVTVEQQNEEQFVFEFPADFAFSDIINYKIVDNELIRDEYVYPPIPTVPTIEERLSDVEDNIAEIEEAMISAYEERLAHEEQMENALIEVYEMMEG